MPQPINRTSAAELSPRLDEALEIVCNEFRGLDPHQQYRNSFARVLKHDPLGRVTMMGTDQRDLFIPSLRDAIEASVPAGGMSAGGHIFDFGAGDGQTFARVAGLVPEGTTVSLEEPNPDYVADYVAFLDRQPHLRLGVALTFGLDELVARVRQGNLELPESVDLALGMHMLYFTADLLGSLEVMLRVVRPGGMFFGVVTDESASFTGCVHRTFVEAGGAPDDDGRRLLDIDERRRLLAPEVDGGGGLVAALAGRGIDVEVDSVRQPSRMYGHSLVDLLAISNIGGLVTVEGSSKFEAAATVLRDRSEEVDLRIETDGPRIGMWSVSQPQWVTTVRRVR